MGSGKAVLFAHLNAIADKSRAVQMSMELKKCCRSRFSIHISRGFCGIRVTRYVCRRGWGHPARTQRNKAKAVAPNLCTISSQGSSFEQLPIDSGGDQPAPNDFCHMCPFCLYRRSAGFPYGDREPFELTACPNFSWLACATSNIYPPQRN